MPTPSRLLHRSAAVASTLALAAAFMLPAAGAQAAHGGNARSAGSPGASPSSSVPPSPGDTGHEEKTPNRGREGDYAAYTLDPTSPLVLVNEHHPLRPRDYVPRELVAVDGSGARMVPEAAAALEKLLAAARDDGHALIVESAYRSYDYQVGLFRRYTAMYGEAYASRISARPGTSEHQLGLSADIGVASGQCSLKACLATLPAGKWTAAHAAEYGFIIRYPQDRQEITGYNFEPWHVRYVGVPAAQAMRRQGIDTFEQYSDELDAIRTARQAQAKREAAAAQASREAAAERARRIAEDTGWMPRWARPASAG